MHLERLGCFVRRGHAIYRLDSQTYALVDTIDAFNAMPLESKAASDAFIRFAQIKDLAEGVGAQLDRFIAEQRVLVPSRVGLDLIVEEDGRITFAPKIEGAPEHAMRRAFLAADDVEEVYALEQPDGGRVRVVLDKVQREVLRRMQRVRHLGGADRISVELRSLLQVGRGQVARRTDRGPETEGTSELDLSWTPTTEGEVDARPPRARKRMARKGVTGDARSHIGSRGHGDRKLTGGAAWSCRLMSRRGRRGHCAYF